MRRIVTGNNSSGKSVVVSDGEPPRVVRLEALPGLELIEVWGTEGIPLAPTSGEDPTVGMESWVPAAGGTRFRIMRLPSRPETERALAQGLDLSALREEYRAKAPGLAETHEADDPAMHTTDTIDYGVVLSGEVWLELDDGAQLHLKAGDCFVQNGTRHAWRNQGEEPCVIAGVMVGAVREESNR